MKKNLFGYTLEEIKHEIRALSIPAFRAQQIVEWLYQRNATDFQQMINLPKAMRQLLAEHFSIMSVEVLRQQTSKDNQTTKILLGYPDGITVETVLMRHSYGNSVCVSSQAGCAMGCIFCASTLNGLIRNLTAGEILAQVIYMNNLLQKENQKVNTIVIMGSGEPLANYENVLGFIRLCHAPYTLNLGYRNITLSTSGIVPMIERLATEKLPITLSISLHASNDSIRSELMPINRHYDIHMLTVAANNYALATGRRVTYEYILVAGKNDSAACAHELSKLLKGQLANVNLIPVNPVIERGLDRPDLATITTFAQILSNHHIQVTIRREMGNDIQAACGQLRNQHLAEQS